MLMRTNWRPPPPSPASWNSWTTMSDPQAWRSESQQRSCWRLVSSWMLSYRQKSWSELTGTWWAKDSRAPTCGSLRVSCSWSGSTSTTDRETPAWTQVDLSTSLSERRNLEQKLLVFTTGSSSTCKKKTAIWTTKDTRPETTTYQIKTTMFWTSSSVGTVWWSPSAAPSSAPALSSRWPSSPSSSS